MRTKLGSPRDFHRPERFPFSPVGIGKGGLDANGLLVVHEGLVELPLLLEDGGQVGVCRGELREHLQGLEVQAGGILGVSLDGRETQVLLGYTRRVCRAT